jgi:hypothetical protein
VAVATFGVVEAGPAELAALRDTPVGVGAVRLPANFHRYSDGQAVAGVEAVFRAIRAAGWEQRSFADWGVVAAPRFLGRLVAARALNRFAHDGPFAGSPFYVTHHSLHAVAGMLSVALGLRGPSFGAGGGAESLAEGLLAALTAAGEGSAPGLWAVFSECEPEAVPDAEGANTRPGICRAVALALTGTAGPAGLRLRAAVPPAEAGASLAGLAAFLTGPGPRPARWACGTDWGGGVELAAA